MWLTFSLARISSICLPLAIIPAIAGEPLKVPVAVRLEPDGGSGPPVDDSRPCLVVDVGGVKEPLRLPVVADTSLLKDGNQPRAADQDIQLRDNRWHQGLFRFDVSSVPKDAEIRSARLEFTVGWAEKKGPARIEFHPMLAEWGADASWLRPSAGAADWNGLAAGKDYEKEPTAVYEIAEVKSSTRVVLDGFGPLVSDWISGRKKNHGVVAQLYGKAMQVNIRSMETPVKKPALHQFRLMAGTAAPFRFTLDRDIVRRLVLSPDDVRGGELAVTILGKDDLSGVKVVDAGGRPCRVEDRRIILSGFSDALKKRLSEGAESMDFTLSLESSKSIAIAGPDGGREQRPVFSLATVDHENVNLFDKGVVPRPGVYVEHKGGNLFYGGERLRLWGGVGYGSIPRMRRMGFNAWRVWPVGDKAYDEKSITSGDFADSSKGDGSEMDRLDRMYAEFKSEGFFLMATQLMGVMPAKLLTRDDSFVAGGEDWEAWKAAVKEIPGSEDAGGSADFRRFAFVDERAERARFKHAVNFLNRVNPYTGKRYAEEEHIAVWELDNELGIVRHLLEGGGAKWPAYFREKLDARWSAWVSGRYADEKSLLEAWGRLEEGERYGFLKAIAAGAGNEGAAKRAGDFTRFVIELADGFYQDLRTLCRGQAAGNVGVAVAAFSFDTQYRPSIPWIYQQTRGDVANFGMYFWDATSQIAKQPSAYVMDSHTVDDKVTVIYETNHARPSPYRTEFPFRLAALASWQDWDAVFFHYWGGNPRGESDEEYMGRPMKYMTASHYWDGVHHDSDPAMTSMMALAGRMFVDGMIPAAPKPAIYRVGGKGIFSATFANGIGMKEDAFRRGARLRFEPEGDFNLIKENAVAGPEDGAVRGGPVTWDWEKGRLIIDTPTAKVFVGPAPSEGWKFEGGITLSGFSKPWISFALVSADGRPLADCSKAWISSMADAVNSGFEFDWKVKGGPTEQAKAIRNMGNAPVIVDRVDYTVSFPTKMKWQVEAYDFALRRMQDISGATSVVRVRSQPRSGDVPNDRPQEIWMNLLTISDRNEAAEAVMDPSPGAVAPASAKDGKEASDEALAGIWNPLPGLSWGDNAVLARRKLERMEAKHGAVTSSSSAEGETVVEVADSHAVMDAPARTELSFIGGKLKDIVVTFSQPPPLREVVADYEKRFGRPVEKKLTEEQFGQSTVRWIVPGDHGELVILLTDAQAVMKLSYSLARK